VFQAFLTTFLIDHGHKTPIQSKDELYASGIKLAFQQEYNLIFENGDQTEASIVKRNRANCRSFAVCKEWAKYQKNISILLSDIEAEESYIVGDFGEKSETLLCMLEDGVVYSSGQTMLMFYGGPLMKRFSEIIDPVVEAGLYNRWLSLYMRYRKLISRKIAIVHPLDEYYSFNLYYMQPAFYLLLMGWCLSALSFIIEFLYRRV
jgi:hypothetical protein